MDFSATQKDFCQRSMRLLQIYNFRSLTKIIAHFLTQNKGEGFLTGTDIVAIFPCIKVKFGIFKKNYYYSEAKVWNGIPLNIKTSSTTYNFKKKLMDFLLRQR